MKFFFLLLAIYPSLSFLQSGISLLIAYEYCIEEFVSYEAVGTTLNYSKFRIRMNQNRFFRPLTENAAVNETSLSLDVSNVTLTLITNFALIPEVNYPRTITGFQDTIVQYNITKMIFEKKTEKSSIYLKQFELSKPFISKANDLMIGLRLGEFQKDTGDILFNEILNKTQSRIEFLIAQFNLQFAIDTIFSFSLFDSGVVKNSSLIYGIKNFSYEDSIYTNDGKQILIQNSFVVTFVRIFDKAEVVARTNMLIFKDKKFVVNEFHVVKSEIEVFTKNLNDNCDSILKEAARIFYEEFDF